MRRRSTVFSPPDELGEFSLQPRQADVRAIFLPLRQVQRDLGLPARVNTILSVGSNRGGDDCSDGARTVTLEDLGATVAVSGDPQNLIVEGRSGIMSESLGGSRGSGGHQPGMAPDSCLHVSGEHDSKRRSTDSLFARSRRPISMRWIHGSSSPSPAATDSIVLNEWAARDLDAAPGDTIAIDYFLWDTAAGLTSTPQNSRWRRTIPIEGFAADRRLAPEYPGDHCRQQSLRLGSAISGRSVASAASGRGVLEAVSNHTEGVHRFHTWTNSCGRRASARRRRCGSPCRRELMPRQQRIDLRAALRPLLPPDGGRRDRQRCSSRRARRIRRSDRLR